MKILKKQVKTHKIKNREKEEYHEEEQKKKCNYEFATYICFIASANSQFGKERRRKYEKK